MALGKRLINTGAAAADVACSTDSVQAFGEDNAFSSNVALYQLNSDGGTTNNVPDTTTNYNGTASNVTYATGQFGNAAVFNGSSSKIELPNTSLGITDASNFSISYWFNTNSATQDNQSVIWANGSNAGARFGSGINATSQGGDTSVYFGMPVDGSFTYVNSGTSAFTANTWVHVVCVKSSTTGMSLYVDNVLKANNTGATGSGSFVASGKNAIGMYHTTSDASLFNGSIDQVRIFDKAISAEDVATLYAETSSTASNTNPFSEGSGVALYTMDYDASEASGYYDGTPTNVEFGVGGKINYGARFNGSSSNIDLGFNDTYSNFSISAWVKTNSNTTAQSIVGKSWDGGNRSFSFDIRSTGLTLNIAYDNNNTTFSFTNTSFGQLSNNTWYFVCFTWENGVGLTLTVNDNTQTHSNTNNIRSNNSNYFIGTQDYRKQYQFFNGDIDQVRIFSKALSSSEISTLYAETACVYDSTTNDVNYPFDNATNVEAYYKLDNSSEDYVGGNDGTDTNIEYRFGRYGQAAVFDGSSSEIDLPVGLGASGDRARSFWINVSAFPASGGDTIYYIGQQGANDDYEYLSVRSNGTIRYQERHDSGGAGDLTIDSQTTISLNQWYNIIIVFDGLNRLMYINSSTALGNTGTKSTPTVDNSAYAGNLGSFRGVAGTLTYDGSIDQVRIYSTALTSSQVADLYNEKPEVDTSNFKTVLYEGNGSTNYISNVGFDLDVDNGGDGGLVWIKARETANSHALFDTVRGATNQLSSDLTAAEGSYSTVLSSFDANGFFVETSSIVNTNNDGYVAWVWKGGGDAVTGTGTGVTNVSVSANTEAGFSIVKYTGGNSASNTVNHGLTDAEMIILKDLTDGTNQWRVWHKDLTSGYWLYFNLTNAQANAAVDGGIRNVDSNSFGFINGTTGGVEGVNSSASNYIAYVWKSIAGYSKIGSYTGGGTTKRVYVDSNDDGTGTGGFKPSFVMIKASSSLGGNQAYGSWVIHDDKRAIESTDNVTNPLYANRSYQEGLRGQGSSASGVLDLAFNDDGFTINHNGFEANGSGITYIYMAFK